MAVREARSRVLVVLGLLLGLPALAGAVDPAGWAERLKAAADPDRETPSASVFYPSLQPAGAYRLQSAYVEARRREGDEIGGFKAGVTAAETQERLGLDTPVAGVLFAGDRVASGDRVVMRDYRQPRIEVEIALILDDGVREQLADPAALRERVRAVAPAVEVAEVGFGSPGTPSAVDLIAANTGAAKYVVGSGRPVAGIDLGRLRARLHRGSKMVLTGDSSEVMGHPLRAALWLVNRAIAEGYTVAPGQVLLTGAIGGMADGQPGAYRAEFDALGTVRFELR